MNIWGKLMAVAVSALIPILFVGCAQEPDSVTVKNWLSGKVSACKGAVDEFVLVKEGLFSYKFVGYAKVVIAGEEYFPNLSVYSDNSGKGFYSLDTDPCKLHSIATFRR